MNSLALMCVLIGQLFNSTFVCSYSTEPIIKFTPDKYIFLGEVTGFIGPVKSTKVVGRFWGVKVKIVDALNVPKSTIDFVEIYSFGLTNSCRLIGASRNELMKFYPIGSKVRVVGSESTIIEPVSSTSKDGTIRLEVTEYNYGLIARNDLDEGFDVSAQSYYDYERDKFQTKASKDKASIYYYYSTVGDFELWKDLIRLHRTENESARFEILKRLSKYHLKGYTVDYSQLVKNYLNSRAMIDELLKAP